MTSYHSAIKDEGSSLACGIPILPIKTSVSGPAVTIKEGEDIIDEAIKYFRANVLFQNYKINSSSDKIIVYLTVFIQECLSRVSLNSHDDNSAKKAVTSFSQEKVRSPGAASFFMNDLLTPAKTPGEDELYRGYLKQLQEETARRLLNILFNPSYGTMDLKHWTQFSKRKFLGILFYPLEGKFRA